MILILFFREVNHVKESCFPDGILPMAERTIIAMIAMTMSTINAISILSV